MMRHHCWLAAVTALFALSPFAAAQDENPNRQDSGALFDRIDKNGDGFITADEIDDDRKSTFDRLVRVGDANQDGKLSKAEFVAALRDGRKTQGKKDAPAGKAPPKDKDGARKFNPDAFFNRLDRNRDGKITRDEVPEQLSDRMKQGLKRADANGDGAVSKAEFTKAFARFGGGGAGVEALIKRLDKNSDRKISRAEALGRLKENFGRIDANGDGQLNAAELRKAFSQNRDKKQPKKKVDKKQPKKVQPKKKKSQKKVDKKRPKKKQPKRKQPNKKFDKKRPNQKKRPKNDA